MLWWRRLRGRRQQERSVRPQRQRFEQDALVTVEAGARRFGSRAMNAHVRRLRHPRQRLRVQIGVVQEGAAIEEALAHVADRPLDLALGLRPIGTAGADAKAPMRREAHELGILKQPSADLALIVDDEREVGGRLLENPEFVRFAAHWGFRIRACRPYRAKTKGKVERPISYMRQSFFYGRTFLNDADLNAQALTWAEHTANVRIHRTTSEAPRARFERDERVLLKALALRSYRPLVVPATTQPAPAQYPVLTSVERRPLAWYGRLTGVAR